MCWYLPDYTMFFTDIFKTKVGVGASMVYNENKIMTKLPDFCSIYTAEVFAISY